MIQSLIRHDLAALKPTDDLDHAELMIEDARLGGLPIIDNHKLSGTLLERDFDLYRDAIAKQKQPILSSLVLPPPLMLPVTAHLYDALTRLRDAPQRFLPVVEADYTFSGVLLYDDVMREAGKLLTATAEGTVMELEVPAHQFRLSDMVRMLEQNETRVLSMASRPSPTDEATQLITLKLETLEPFRLQRTLERYGYIITYISRDELSGVLDDAKHKAQEFIRYLEV